MIDIIQWRVSTGLWNCCQSATGPTPRGCRSIKTDSPNGKKLKTRSLLLSLITVFLFVLTLISGYWELKYNTPLRGIIIHCSWSKVHCTDTVTDINWLQSVVLESDTVYPPPHLRLLLLLSGDIELNPGPIIGEKPTLPSLTGLLKSLDNWKEFGSYLPGITSITIKEIEKKYQGVNQQKGALYSKWLEVFPNASWRNIRIALNRCGANALAESINDCEQKSQEILKNNQANVIFDDASSTLTKAINKLIVHIVTMELYVKKLIPQQTFDCINAGRDSDYLVRELRSRLSQANVPGQYLIDICNVFISQQYKPLTDIATNMLRQLDSSVPEYFPPENCSPDDVQTFTSRMKLQYRYQTIIESGDRVTLGNLVLIERKVDIEHKKMSDHLLRGQVDEVLKMPGINSVNLSDVLQSKQPIVVALYGPPGIGKTTLCRKLLNMWSNGEIKYELVLYCPLRNSKFAEAKDLADLFLFDLSKVFNVVDWFKKRNGEGLLIIFDGWDASSMQSSLVASIIRRKELGKCSVLITSRSCSSSAITSINRHVQVIGFSSEEMLRVIIQTIYYDSKLAQEFIDKKKECDKNGKIFRPNLKKSSTALAVQFINDHNVLSLCYIPLVCFAVIKSYEHHHGNRIHGLTDLYESIVREIINSHMQNRDSTFHSVLIFSAMDLPAPVQKLCEIAFDNLSNTRIMLSEELLSKVGYLGLMTMNFEGEYQFLHSNIQEFLAAWWITNHKHNDIQELFKKLTNSGKFQMCLRFMAGLTCVNKGSILDESYKQYFNEQQLDFQCQRKPLFGLKMDHYYPFYCRNRNIHMDCSASNFLTFPFELLYELENKRLCKELAQSIKNQSLCLNGTSLSLYDWLLCLNYFQIEWDLHLGTIYDQTLTLLRENAFALPCRVLRVKLLEPMTDDIQALSGLLYKTRECYVVLEGAGHYISSDDILQFFSSYNLKVLHLTLNNISVLPYDSSNSTIPQFKERIQKNSALEEVNLKFNGQLGMDSVVSIISGVLKNQTIKSFSLEVKSLDHLIPANIIENLFKHNVTLQNLSLNIPDKFLPPSLNIVEVNTPLTALEMSSKKLVTSILPHITGLCYLILHEPYTPHLIFEFNPSLQTLSLSLDAAKSAIELFNILQDNTTLQSLRVEMDKVFDNTKLFTSLEAMLKQNHTLRSFEMTSEGSSAVYNHIPVSFLSFLHAGITSSTSIEDLSVPIPLSKQHIENVKDLISCKVTLKKCHIDFRPDESYQHFPHEKKKEIMISLYEELADVIATMHANFRILGQEINDLKTQKSNFVGHNGDLQSVRVSEVSEDGTQTGLNDGDLQSVRASEVSEDGTQTGLNDGDLQSVTVSEVTEDIQTGLSVSEDDLKHALEEGTLTYSVSTAFIQGEARVGKTCLKSSILSLPYDEVSTSCIEAPCIAYHYASTDGKCWKLVTDDDMDKKIITEIQKLASEGSALTDNDSTREIEAIPNRELNTDPITQFDTPTSVTPDTLHIASSNEVAITEIMPNIMSQETQELNDQERNGQDNNTTGETKQTATPIATKDIFKHCLEVFNIERYGSHKEWLYFIDSGGQIQFQKLLLAFMPCTTTLILVVNLSNNLSALSSSVMKLSQTEHINFGDKYSLKVEDVLKQVLSAVASNAQQYRSALSRSSNNITFPDGNLQVISVGTHLDEYEKISNGELETLEEKQKKLRSILTSVKDTCDIIYADDRSLAPLYIIDGCKAADDCHYTDDCRYTDKAIEKISTSLKNRRYEIKVPLKWHYFSVLLRKEAEKTNGVLTVSSCIKFGIPLGMTDSDVHSALKFFHILKLLFYYDDSPAKDIVFVKLESLINIIQDLVVEVCESRSDQEEQPKDEDIKKLAVKSYLSTKILKSCDSFKDTAKFLSNDDDFSNNLLGLFEHLKIAAKLPKEEFLMPALLPVGDTAKPQFLPSTIPLLFYFGSAEVPTKVFTEVPMGLYCAVIVHLLTESESKKPWRIITRDRDKCCSNYFTLQRNVSEDSLGVKVVLVEQLKCIEVYCDKKEKRHGVKKMISEAIDEVIKDIKLHVKPTPKFYCPCTKERDHTARVEVKEKIVNIICDKENDNQVSDEHKEYCSWFMESQKIEDLKGKALHSSKENILNEDKLMDVIGALKEGGFTTTNWRRLGLQLSISHDDLTIIEANYPKDVVRCLEECLVKWFKTGKATYTGLAGALDKMGEGAAADHIRTNHISFSPKAKRRRIIV